MPNAAQNAAQQSDYSDKPMPAFMSRRSLKVGVRSRLSPRAPRHRVKLLQIVLSRRSAKKVSLTGCPAIPSVTYLIGLLSQERPFPNQKRRRRHGYASG